MKTQVQFISTKKFITSAMLFMLIAASINIHAQFNLGIDRGSSLNKGNFMIGASFNNLSIINNFSNSAILYLYHLDYAISDNVEIGVQTTNNSPLITHTPYAELSARFNFDDKKTSCTLSYGTFFGNNLKNMDVKFISNHSSSKTFEFVTSTSLEMLISRSVLPVLGVSLGTGFSNDLSVWSVRPQFGINLPVSFESSINVLFNFSLGFTYHFSPGKGKDHQ